MAVIKWVTVGEKFCDLINQRVKVREQRVFADDFVSDPDAIRTLARSCTAAIDCNMAGIPCKQAFLNPSVDRFFFE